MMIQQFEFNAYWKLLKTSLNSDLFNQNVPTEFFLTPNNLLDTFIDKGYQIIKNTIPGWYSIEYEDNDLPLSEIINNTFDYTKHSFVYIISDESFTNGKVLYCQLNNQLTDDLLWDYCSLGATDFIISSEDCSQICIITHEGTLFVVKANGNISIR